MRKTLLLTLILLVCAAWAVAQQGTMPQTGAPGAQRSPGSMGNPGSPNYPGAPSAPGSSDNQMPQSSASETSIEGCLSGSPPNFTVIDKAGTTYQLQLPANADTSKLKDHVGQEVRVTGSTASATDSAAASSHGAAGSTPSASGSTPATGAAGPTINVTKMSKIADTCTSNPSGARPSQK